MCHDYCSSLVIAVALPVVKLVLLQYEWHMLFVYMYMYMHGHVSCLWSIVVGRRVPTIRQTCGAPVLHRRRIWGAVPGNRSGSRP